MIVVGVLAAQTATSKGKYAVIDHSDGLGVEIRNEILWQDLREFGRFIAFRSTFENEFLTEVKQQTGLNAAEDPQSVEDFVESVMPYLHFPVGERRSLPGSTLTARIATWWNENQELIAELVPSVSSERYVEWNPGQVFSEEELNPLVETEALLGYIVIPSDLVQTTENAKFVTKNFLKSDVASWYGNYATQVVRRHRVEQANIPAADAQWVVQHVSFVTNRTVTQDQTGSGT